MKYIIENEDYIPLSCQPEDGYSLSEAVARYNREVDFMRKFCEHRFPGKYTDREIENDFHIRELTGQQRIVL